MILTIKNLEECFKEAKKEEWEYVAVKVTVPGAEGEEIIINPKSNYDNKLEYYKKAYNEDLTLKAFSQIRITGFTFGDTFDQIQHDLR